ncbi:MAG: chromate transporter [Kaiparowitsia implicata GSE-PSE-MK54-09C]|jgi:chromate transporter|nr:chromate transporter [Kaiparowitsia implicata GSE-PSE-MK54-09C]
MQIALQLFRSFLLIGIGAYGGGLVTIPLIQHEIVVNQQWLTFDQMASLLAVAQMTPGPIAVNAATFVGFQVNGVMGAAIATFAVILPAILILLWLAPFVDRISHNRSVFKIRQGIQLGVLSLILYATWSYGAIAIKGWLDLLIGIAAFAVLVAFEGKLHPIAVILACGVVGLLVF